MRSGIRCAAALLQGEAEEPRDHAEHAGKHDGHSNQQNRERYQQYDARRTGERNEARQERSGSCSCTRCTSARREPRSGIAQSSAVAICDGCMDDCDGRREEAARGALER